MEEEQEGATKVVGPMRQEGDRDVAVKRKSSYSKQVRKRPNASSSPVVVGVGRRDCIGLRRANECSACRISDDHLLSPYNVLGERAVEATVASEALARTVAVIANASVCTVDLTQIASKASIRAALGRDVGAVGLVNVRCAWIITRRAVLKRAVGSKPLWLLALVCPQAHWPAAVAQATKDLRVVPHLARIGRAEARALLVQIRAEAEWK